MVTPKKDHMDSVHQKKRNNLNLVFVREFFAKI